VSVLIGVDAGGTRTTAAVARGDGAILALAESGPGRMRPGEAAVAAAAIFTAARDALQRARLSAPGGALVIGASGVAHAAERAALAAALEGCGLAARMQITTDAEIALEAAFGEAPGIVLLAGTGSVAWARMPDGTTERAGGLGPVLGDRGSGHDLGREALRAVGAGLELELSLDLTSRICAHLKLGPADLPRWSLGAAVADIAALAPVVLDAALAGDRVATTLARDGARQLGALVAGLARRLPPDVRVAWGGGLLATREDYRTMVLESLREFAPAAVVTQRPLRAVEGAVTMARRMVMAG